MSRHLSRAVAVGILCCLIIGIGSFAVHLWHLRQRSINENTAAQIVEPTVIYRSESPQITIPFRVEQGVIVVEATSEGRPVQCMFDTGVNYEVWPDALGLTAKSTGESMERYIPVETFAPRPVQWVILNELKIGDLEIRDCPGAAFASLPHDPVTIPWVRLGNNIFAHFIVTIDYIKHELLISPAVSGFGNGAEKSAPSILLAKHTPSTLMKFQWSSRTDDNRPHVILLKGGISGNPISIALDTGIGFYGLQVVKKQLCAELVRQYSTNPSVHLPPDAKITLKKVKWNVGPLNYDSPIALSPSSSDNAPPDALLGVNVLMYYRTTINYPLHEVLFQWNYPLSSAEALRRLRRGQPVPYFRL